MSGLPWFPWMPKDWLTSQARLAMTLEQRGAYTDLLSQSWLLEPPCTLPDDDATLARLLGVSLPRWRKIGGLVREQFEVVPGGLRHPKLYAIWLDSQDQHERRVNAGRAGGNAKAAGQQSSTNAPSNSLAMLDQCSTNALATTDTRTSTVALTEPPPPPRPREVAVVEEPLFFAVGPAMHDEFLSHLESARVRPGAFVAAAVGALDGLDTPAITPDELRQAVTDFLANNAPANLRSWRSYLRGAKPLPSRNGSHGKPHLKPSVQVPDYGSGTQEVVPWPK